MHHEQATPSGDLREYVAVLRRHRWAIVLIVTVTVASALFFSFRQTPVYRSETQVLVQPVPSAPGQVVPTLNMENERARASSFPVAERVRDEVGVAEAPDELLEDLDVSVEATSEVLTIAYTDPDAGQARRLAQAFAQQYLDLRRESALSELQARLDAIDRQIAESETRLIRLNEQLQSEPGPGRAARLNAEVARINADLPGLLVRQRDLADQVSTVGQSGEIIAPAALPTSPASPNHVRNGLLALVVGLALGMGFAFVRERLDDSLAGREDLEHLIGAPVLAVVPVDTGWRKRDEAHAAAVSDPKSPPAEAHRTLRTNLLYLARERDLRLLAVTSPGLGEGKSTTTANLAATLAKTGKRVIAVSCDLRRPRLHAFFGVRNDVGVTTVLAGSTTMAQAAQRVGIDTLRVLPSGPVPHNPAELLGSEEMEQLLADLRRNADFILLDTAPVLAVSDALILASRCDGVLVVTDALTTSRSAAAHTREQLEQVGARIVGGVLNNFDPSRARNYASYYRYYYSPRYRPQEAGEGNGRSRSQAGDTEEMWRS